MRIRGHQFILLAVAGMLASAGIRVATAQPRVLKNTSAKSATRFHSPGQFGFEQLLKPLVAPLNELASQSLTMPVRAQVARSSRPVKQIAFQGGDHVTAEVLHWMPTEVELRLLSGQKMTVPRFAIADVQTPRGEQEVLYESFEPQTALTATSTDNVLRPKIAEAWTENRDSGDVHNALSLGKVGEPLQYEFPQALPASRVQLWLKISDSHSPVAVNDQAKPSPELSIDFEFSTDPTAQLSMRATTKEASVLMAGLLNQSPTRQSVALSGGWHCLTALFLADRTLIVIDENLLWSASRSLGPLRAIRFSGQTGAIIGDLQVSRCETPLNGTRMRPSTQDDCLALVDGEELFSRVSQVTPASVVLADSTGERVVGWPHVAGFSLRPADKPVSGPLLPIGLSAVIDFQLLLDHPQSTGDRITATITHIDRQFVIVAHPWLGKLAIPWSQIARIAPQFFGQSMTLDARRRHLGDAIRDDFHQQMPDGTEWITKATIPAQTNLANTQAWLSLDVIDLEPAGLQTPPASPFLRELRAGQLLTKISINDQPAGDLNRWIQYRATSDRPERIRCLLPKGLLRGGENAIRLHQIPLKSAETRFDNCELSNLRLELVDPLR